MATVKFIMQHNNNNAILVSDNVTQTTIHVTPTQREGNIQWCTIGWGGLSYVMLHLFKTG